MARYNVGNVEYSEFEYAVHRTFGFSWILFLIAAGLAFFYSPLIVPEDWPKYLRFGSMSSLAVIAGLIAGFCQHYIYEGIFLLIVASIASAAFCWLWMIA